MMPYFNPVSKQFFNYKNEDPHHFSDSINIFFKQKVDSPSSFFPENFQIQDWTTTTKIVATSKTPLITWLGHSTFLIQVENINIITDPVFFDITYMGFPSYPRKMQLGIPLADLPQIDLIIISHMHRDHVDEPSLAFLQKRNSNTILLAPKGSKHFFTKQGFNVVQEFTWWEKFEHKQIKLHFLPAIHWSNRGLFDINKYLWGSWMIQTDHSNIYFAGDSAYAEHYKQIASQFKKIDIALMPIGPIEPRAIVKKAHMSAEEAVQAFIDLNADLFIPMHWGTFGLGTDLFATALNSLEKAEKKFSKDLQNKKIKTLKFGECVNP